MTSCYGDFTTKTLHLLARMDSSDRKLLGLELTEKQIRRVVEMLFSQDYVSFVWAVSGIARLFMPHGFVS